jgi:hypothetical protein
MASWDAMAGEERPGLSWALAFFAWGVEQEKDKKARENPKITPISTRLKMKKFLEDNFLTRFMLYSPYIHVKKKSREWLQ